MAKIGFTKLGLKQNNEIKTITFNEQVIEVKQYLPVKEKLDLISNVLEFSHDQNNFSNPIKINAYMILEIIERYTNINFTEKQKEDPVKLYDLIDGNGFSDIIISSIPEKEYLELKNGLLKTVSAFYTYRNSALGLLDILSQDYSDVTFDLENIQKSISDPKALELLKQISPLLNGGE